MKPCECGCGELVGPDSRGRPRRFVYGHAGPHFQGRPLQERFDEKYVVDSETGCWVWQAAKSLGYGQIQIKSRPKFAHRVSWQLHRGEIPAGHEIDHLCENRLCVNPDHLEPVPGSVNRLRSNTPPARNALKTHCIHGHPFDEENTYVYPSGGRACRECLRQQQRAARAARAA